MVLARQSLAAYLTATSASPFFITLVVMMMMMMMISMMMVMMMMMMMMVMMNMTMMMKTMVAHMFLGLRRNISGGATLQLKSSWLLNIATEKRSFDSK